MTFHDSVLAVLGTVPEFIEPGKWHRFSTNGKRSDTSGWCKLFEDGRCGVFGDFRNAISERWSAIDKNSMTPAERGAFKRQVARASHEHEVQEQEKHHANADYIADLLSGTVEVTAGDPVARYFEHRALGNAWNVATCLRLHPGLPYSHDGQRLGVFPVMVAPVQAPDGRVVALHRTYLTRDGHKAHVPTVKKLTPASGSLRGAAIRLQQVRGRTVAVAEGIETAMAAATASGMPVWSTYSAQGLASFAWPLHIRKLMIFGDADDAGRTATEALRLRAVKAGLETSAIVPRTEGLDWADVYAAEGANA